MITTDSRDPSHYTSLAPFQTLFNLGLPILTYHKLGPRPRNARLKGLYVSEKLFGQQLAELRAAGFTTIPLPPNGDERPTQHRRITLTFDDGYQNVFRYALEPLASNGFRAIQYLVAARLGLTNDWDVRIGEASEALMDETEVREWLAAGHEIGSHTLTHPHLTQVSAQQARTEIQDSKKHLEDTFGVLVRHFCYPYGDWNPAIRDMVMEAGYASASTTLHGVNTIDTSPFELRRITARYPSRNWQLIWRGLRSLFQRQRQ